MNNLNEILIRDKFSNLEEVAEILKGEITPIARNFFLLNGEPVVRYKRDGEQYIFSIEIKTTRVKPFGNHLI